MSRNQELAHGFMYSRSYQADIEPATAAAAAEYHNRTHDKDGNSIPIEDRGSSFHVHGGERVDGGYSVGGLEKKPEKRIAEGRITITPDEYQAHRDQVRSTVSHPDAIAGTWVEDGGVTADASQRVESRDEAKRLQTERGERAVYNITAGKTEDLR